VVVWHLVVTCGVDQHTLVIGTLRQAWLVQGWVTVHGFKSLSHHIGKFNQLSLAIPLWLGRMSTGNGLTTADEEAASSA